MHTLKSLILYTLSFISSFTAFARTADEARALANQYTGETCNLYISSTPSIKSSAADNQPYYIFNSSDRFVIVSGSDRMPAILGSSDNGTFDESSMPPQLQSLLNYYAEVASVAEATGIASPAMAEIKQTAITISTATWHQQKPFNNKCPSSCITGCEATAMAILMKYYGYPTTGQGSHSYTWNNTTLSYDFNRTFDWANMLNSYSGSYNTTQANAVAELMYACGVALEMNYGPTASGAQTARQIHLSTFFKYNNSISVLDKSNYTDAQWQAIIDASLTNKHPVIYDGCDSELTSGHCFIIDGRSTTVGKYHFNWGWSGNYNGDFYLTGLTPGSGHNYSYCNHMVINAVPEITANGIKFEIIDEATRTVRTRSGSSQGAGNSISGSITIPSTVTDSKGITYTVTEIGNYSFTNNSAITAITIPSTVKTIGERAFYGCSLLKAINIPEGVTSVWESAFSNCSSAISLSLPSTIKEISSNAFAYCSSLNGDFIIPSTITTCDNNAFTGTSLKKIAFPSALGLTSTSTTTYVPYPVNAVIDNGWIYSADRTTLIFAPSALADGYTIPGSITAVENNAFARCDNLQSLNIGTGDQPVSFANNAFGSIKITSLDASRSWIGWSTAASAFPYVTSVTLNDGVTNLPTAAFKGNTNITEIAFPASLITVGDEAFMNCANLSSVTIAAGLTTLGNAVFKNCTSIPSVSLPSTLSSIGDEAFMECSGLTTFKVPIKCTTVGASAFKNCVNIETVTLPTGLTSLGESAFFNCSSLQSIKIFGKVVTIEPSTFAYCRSLTSATISSGTKTIGTSAFSYCSGLTTLTLPKSVNTIEDYAFTGCNDLTELTLPEGIGSIGKYAFQNCTKIGSLTLPMSVTEIGVSAFAYCNAINEVHYETSMPFEFSELIFTSSIYTRATLYVSTLESVKKVIASTTPWKLFDKVTDPVLADITCPDSDNTFDPEAPIEIYDLNGLRLTTPFDMLPTGIYIIRQGSRVIKIAKP